MPQHIGIVACTAEGAALCYRTICLEGPGLMGPRAHPEISLHTISFARYMEHLDRYDWPGVGALMLESAETLARAGADFLICPDNTIHQALPHVLPRSPRPWLHIAEVVAAQAAGARLPAPGHHGHPLAGRERGLSGGARRPRHRVPASEHGGAGRDQPHHHGRAGERRARAGGCPVLPARDRADEGRRLRRGGARAAPRSRSS